MGNEKAVSNIEKYFIGISYEDHARHNSKRTIPIRFIEGIRIPIPSATSPSSFRERGLAEQAREEINKKYGIPLEELHLYRITETLTELD